MVKSEEFIGTADCLMLQTGCRCNRVDRSSLGLVHTFRFSPGRQVPLIAGQSSRTQESIGVFTQPGRLAGREFTGRLPGSTRIHPLLCPAAGR